MPKSTDLAIVPGTLQYKKGLQTRKPLFTVSKDISFTYQNNTLLYFDATCFSFPKD